MRSVKFRQQARVFPRDIPNAAVWAIIAAQGRDVAETWSMQKVHWLLSSLEGQGFVASWCLALYSGRQEKSIYTGWILGSSRCTALCKLVVNVTAHSLVLLAQHQMPRLDGNVSVLSEMQPQTLMWKVRPPLKSPAIQKYSLSQAQQAPRQWSCPLWNSAEVTAAPS